MPSSIMGIDVIGFDSNKACSLHAPAMGPELSQRAEANRGARRAGSVQAGARSSHLELGPAAGILPAGPPVKWPRGRLRGQANGLAAARANQIIVSPPQPAPFASATSPQFNSM